MVSDSATRKNKSSKQISDTISVSDTDDKSDDITTRGNIQKKGQMTITRSSNARRQEELSKDSTATLMVLFFLNFYFIFC